MTPLDSNAEPAGVGALLTRRSVSPKRLGWPAPSDAQLALVIHAGLRAPDHAGLTPWRVIHIPMARRDGLAQLFALEKQRRNPLASAEEIARAREHATRAPTLLAFVVCVHADAVVPPHEQWLAAGAALGNMLNAFHALGFGAIVLSGDRCADSRLAAALGVNDEERLAGFISAGTVSQLPHAAPSRPVNRVWSTWGA
ncbi:nitroreductase family protein [Variovorax boronicumulans]